MNPLRFIRELPTRAAGRFLLAQGSSFFEASRTNDALTLFQQAFELYRRLAYDECIADATAHLATTHYYLGNFDEVLRFARLSLRISSRKKDRLRMSRALTYIGNVCLIQGRLIRALAFHRWSLRFAIEIRNRHSEIRARLNLGDTLAAMGWFADAFQEVSLALSLFTPKERSNRFAITAENSLGAIYRAVNQHDLADNTFRSALQRAMENGDVLVQASVLTNIGIRRFAQGLVYRD